MQVKKQNIILDVGVTKKVADIIISISIPFKGIANCCFKKLICGMPSSPEIMKGTEESAISYALFEVVRDKLSGSGLELVKTKVSEVSCASIGDNLVFTFHTQGTGTALRKSCGLAVSTFNPVKLFSKYSENMKFLTGKGGNKEEFNFVAKKLAEGIKKSVHITVVGKINTELAKLQEIVGAVHNKMSSVDIPSAKEIEAPGKRVSDSDELTKPFPIVKCSGLDAAVVADYIRNNSNGMSVGIANTGVVVYNHGWEAKHKQLKDKKRISDYVHKKYAGLEDKEEFSCAFAYFAISQGFIDSDVAAKIISSKLKTTRFIEILQKTL